MNTSIQDEKERWERYVRACNGMPNPIARRKYNARIRNMENLRAVTIRKLIIQFEGRATA